jgi:Protein of unknown function (DUF3592)
MFQTSHFLWLAPLACGVALIGYALHSLVRMMSVYHWPTQPATIIAARVGEQDVVTHLKITHYYPVVRFEYASPTGLCTSENFTIAHCDHRSTQPTPAMQLLSQYPVGAVVPVYVSPSNPRLAVLRRTVSPERRNQYLATLAAGILVTGLSIVGSATLGP